MRTRLEIDTENIQNLVELINYNKNQQMKA